MILLLTIYFLAGVLQNIIFTLNVRYVAREKIFPAVLCSFLTVIVGMTVFYNIITRLGNQRGIIAIIIYALGIGVGTFLAMKLKIGLKK